MTRRTETLARIDLFKSLDADVIRRLDTQCSWRRASAGEWLIDYQDASRDVFFQQFSMRVSRSCSLRLGESERPQSAMK